MAVDLLTMPLNRYLSGNYIPPVMRDAWENCLQYSVVLRDGIRHLPPGTPYGGPEAAVPETEMMSFVKDILPHFPQGIAA